MKWLTDAEIADAVRAVEGQRAGATRPLPHACFVVESPADVGELHRLLSRAANTLEPRDWPSWLAGWFERLERMQ